jgi:5-methylcytosine-specific restriction endonuclease McrA
MGAFDQLGTLVDAQKTRRATPKYAIPSRLDEKTQDARVEKAAEKAWRKGCIARDGKICQHCRRKVIQQLALAPERLEIHHIKGRADRVVRWDVRNGVVTCHQCHSKLTRHQLFIVQIAAHLFTAENGKTYIDASKPIEFKEAA